MKASSIKPSNHSNIRVGAVVASAPQEVHDHEPRKRVVTFATPSMLLDRDARSVAYGVFIGPGRCPFRVRLTHRTASGDFAYPRGVIHASEYHRLTGIDAMSIAEEGIDTKASTVASLTTTACTSHGSSSGRRDFQKLSPTLAGLETVAPIPRKPSAAAADTKMMIPSLDVRQRLEVDSKAIEVDSAAAAKATSSMRRLGTETLNGVQSVRHPKLLQHPDVVDEYTSPSEGEYRAGFTFAQCIAFVREEDRNPKTGRPIERFGPTWRSLNHAAIAWGLRKSSFDNSDAPLHAEQRRVGVEVSRTEKSEEASMPPSDDVPLDARCATLQLQREAAPHAIDPVLSKLRAFFSVLRVSAARPTTVTVEHVLRRRNGRWLFTGLWNATRVVFTVRDDPAAAQHEADMIALASASAVPLIAFGGHVLVTEYVSDITLASDERAMQVRSADSFAALIETVVSLCDVVHLSKPLSPSQLIASVERDVTWYVAADWDSAQPYRSLSDDSDCKRAARLHLFHVARSLRSPLLADTLLDVFDSWTEEQRNVLNRL